MACDRTISAIHTPSFQYADRILSDWKEAGVRTRRDVELQDEKRRQEKRQKTPSGQENGLARETARRRTPNQFHNFKQRDTDYETLMLQQVKERVQGE